jgi:hypothetical protein
MATKQVNAQLITKWLANNLANKRWAAPCTGQDYAALLASVQVANLWAYSDGQAQRHVIAAWGEIVRTMQPACQYLAFHAVAQALDWDFRWKFWHLAGLDPEAPKTFPGCLYGPEGQERRMQLVREGKL